MKVDDHLILGYLSGSVDVDRDLCSTDDKCSREGRSVIEGFTGLLVDFDLPFFELALEGADELLVHFRVDVFTALAHCL